MFTPALDVSQRYGELGDALEITTFVPENVSVPPEEEQAIDKRSSMSAIGNLNGHVKYQMGVARGQGGGELQWNAAKQALVYPYCGTVVPWAQGQAREPAQMVRLALVSASWRADAGHYYYETESYRNLQDDARVQGHTFKHILVTVWLVNCTYGSRNFQVVANGYTGSMAGEQPYSWVKITFAVLGVLLLILLATVVMSSNSG